MCTLSPCRPCIPKVRTLLPACLPACPSACLLAGRAHACLRSRLHAWLSVYPPCPLGADSPSPTFDPCASYRVSAYMNREDVQIALHAIQVCLTLQACVHCTARCT